MATGILIYEQDKYLLRLLTERLRNMLPDVYIADGTNKTESRDATQFCNECIVLYDKRQYEDSFRDDPRFSLYSFHASFNLLLTESMVSHSRSVAPIAFFCCSSAMVALAVILASSS